MILSDRMMANKLMYIPNYDTKLQRLQLVVDTFGHSTYLTNQLKLKVTNIVKPMNRKV